MSYNRTKRSWCAPAAAAATTMIALAAGTGGAFATTGYFANGTSTASKATAGAAVALETGVMGLAANPALGTGQIDQAEACVALFAPSRSVTITGMGTFESENERFLVPCGGANFGLGNGAALGFLVYGNGGMNTEYADNFFGGGMVPGPLGVNLEQLFIQVNYAADLGEGLSFGIAPVIAAQRFAATGLAGFAGFSSDDTALTNRGDDWSYGAGAVLGLAHDNGAGTTIGASYRTRMRMDPFDKYAGLFAEQGDFDIPATLKLGVAHRMASNQAVTVTAEWERIFYADIAAIGSPFPTSGPLGADDGPGFGWKDMSVLRLGGAYEVDATWTLRGGVSYNTAFTDSSQATLNALAPATPQWHASVGATMRIDDRRALNVAYTHAFDKALAGTMALAPNPPISEQMSQNEVAIGMTWSW